MVKKVSDNNIDLGRRRSIETPSPEESPTQILNTMQKAIIGDIRSIVDDIDFDSKFEALNSAIKGTTTNVNANTTNAILDRIDDHLAAVLGALYGDSGVSTSTNSSSLLSNLSKIDIASTQFKGLYDVMSAIYDNSKQLNESSEMILDAILSTSTPNNADYKLNVDDILRIIESSNSADSMNILSNTINKIMGTQEAIGDVVLECAISLDEILKSIKSTSSSTTAQSGSIASMPDLSNLIVQISSIASIDNKNLSAVSKSIDELFNTIRTVGQNKSDIDQGAKTIAGTSVTLGDFLKSMNDMDKDKLNALGNVLSAIKGLGTSLSMLALTFPLAMVGLFALDKSAPIIERIANNINNIPIDENTNEKLKGIAIVVATTAGVLALAAITSNLVSTNIASFLGFTIIFPMFLYTVVTAVSKAASNIEQNIQDMRDLGYLIAISAATMLIGGTIVMNYPGIILGSMGFAIALGAFLFAVVGAITLASSSAQTSIDNAKQLNILIATCGATLVLGGLFMMIPGMVDHALMFGIMLGLFVVTIGGAFKLMSAISNEDTTKSINQFNNLVAISAASMIVGGLFMMIPGMFLNVLGFGGLLISFTVSMGIAFVLMTAFSDGKAANSIKNFNNLIAISAASMIIGGLFMMIPGMFLNVLGFAAILGGFVLGMSVILTIVSKTTGDAKAINAMRALSIVVSIAAGTLLIGGLLMMIPGMMGSTMMFALTLSIFMGAMAGIMYGVSKIENINKGILGVGVIAAVSFGLAFVMKKFAEIAETVDMSSLLTTLAAAGAMVVGIGGIIALIGWIMTTYPVALGAAGIGGAVFAGIIGLIHMLGDAMQSISTAANSFAELKDIDLTKSLALIGKFGTITTAMAGLANPIVVIQTSLAKKTISSISEVIMAIASSVEAMANLKVPVYKDGKMIGYRELDKGDFEKASTNVTDIITCLGDAIIKTYEGHPEMFSYGLTDFLAGDNAFSRTVKSCTLMGEMISEIASGVKTYAELRMPIYDKTGNIVGYKEMEHQDFVDASNNIKAVITTLAGAIMAVYNGTVVDAKGNIIGTGKEMFSWELIGDNPFAITVKSCTLMGEMISSIAEGVKSYADLRMPIYDSTGKIIGYKPMDATAFDDAATNIGKVITCIGSAIMALYNDPEKQKMFIDGSLIFKDGSNTPFAIITRSLEGVGGIVIDAAKAIKEINGITIPDDIDKKIATILTSIVGGIKAAENQDPSLFREDGLIASWFGSDAEDTQFNIIKTALDGTGKLVIDAADAIKHINDLDVPKNSLGPNGVLANHISNIVTVIPSALLTLAKDEKYNILFGDDGAKLDEINTAINKMSKVIVTLNRMYGNSANMMSNIAANGTLATIAASMDDIIGKVPLSIVATWNAHVTDVNNAIVVLNKTRSMYGNYNALVDYVSNSNNKLNNISNIENFRTETGLINDYVQTINSLDVNRVDRMTSLINAFNKLATNLGSLEKFTSELSNRLSVILDRLSTELNKSAAAIGNSDKAQMKRNEDIKNTISEIKKLMDSPLNVNIRHGEALENDTQDTMPDTSVDTPYSAFTVSQGFDSSGSSLDYGKLTQVIAMAINRSKLGGNSSRGM